MKQCPNCGKQNTDDARFCNGCGTPLDNLGTQQPMASVPPTAPEPLTPAAPVPPTPPTPPAGQPLHPAMPPLPQQPGRKKSNTGLIIGIIAGAIIFVAAASALFYWWVMKSDSPYRYNDPIGADSDTAVMVVEEDYFDTTVDSGYSSYSYEEEAPAAANEYATSSFPNFKHGSDQAFENYVSSLDRKGIVCTRESGRGTIDGSPYSVEFVKVSGGRLTGRYHNEYNGINLDLNGYYAQDGVLHFKLGHKNETSYMILRPTRGHNSYTGYWGKSEKFATLTLN